MELSGVRSCIDGSNDTHDPNGVRSCIDGSNGTHDLTPINYFWTATRSSTSGGMKLEKTMVGGPDIW